MGDAKALHEQRRKRRYNDDEKDDGRSRFQRDRDRVLYSSAFRRLAGVTQVVQAAEGHVFHNRLTHSLKVAQVARRLSEYLLKVGDPEQIVALGGLDPDVAECAALLHDIGHPPFGHAAEYEIQQSFKERHIADGFEGNAQSFRVATWVSSRDPSARGLDLTAASLAGLLKYPWHRQGDEGTRRSVKFGYYASEKDDFSHARSFLDNDERKSLEAEIMDWADDVTYAVHDVEDSFRSAMIPLDQLILGTEERGRFIDWFVVFDAERKAEREHTSAEADKTRAAELAKAGAKKKALDEFFDLWKNEVPFPVVREPFSNTRKAQGMLQRFSSMLISRYLAIGAEGVSLGDPASGRRMLIDDRVRTEVDTWKSLMIYYVYEHPALVAQQCGQRAVIKRLFDELFDAIAKNARFSGLIPAPFREERDEIRAIVNEGERNRRAGRLVADIICSMTEQQALDLHARMSGFAAGSIRDVIIH